MLALLFSCCGLRHRTHELPGERSPLIPHADDTPTPQPRVIDHQKFKERLGSVVRSKQGKMVNVNAQFPFNLHNQDHPDHSSGSSRNVSGGTLPSTRAPSPSPPHLLQKSPSTGSLHQEGEDAPHYLPLVVHRSAPILNVHLVKSARSTQSTRGRSPRSGELNGRTQTLDSFPAPDTEHTPSHPPETSAHLDDFSIHDAGAVARSWGD